MKQTYLINEGTPRLLLFFAGWGTDETLFRHYRPEGCDFMLCYDYRTLDFEAAGLARYEEIRVVGWSMGVWAATPWLADDRRGIPVAIYRGTLEGLSPVSLHKFLRRMCRDTVAFRSFLAITPRRPLEELRDELANAYALFSQRPADSGFAWTQAVVGENDRIVPPQNQLNAWREMDVPVRTTADAHYQEELFAHYLQDGLWTNS